MKWLTHSQLFWALLLATLAFSAAGCGEPGAEKTSDGAFIIHADKDWQSTGLEVSSGDRLAIRYAAGGWSPWPGDSVDGSGVSGDCASATVNQIVPNVCHASLIARIGDGTPFHVGNAYERAVTHSGKVFLRINDTVLGDNGGSLWVTVDASR